LLPKPIDTMSAFPQQNLIGKVRTPSTLSAFSLGNIFHTFSLPSWPPRIGQSTFPQPTTMTVQPSSIVMPH
jgi:hypothetical protein